jgi:hypothetical protein
MLVFDFITQEEIDDLPDDDPQAAFMAFVRIAQRRLAERIRKLDPSNNPEEWDELHEARNGFMNVVIAAAKKFGVEPLASTDVPSIKDFNTETYRQFRADIDHLFTQLLLDNSSRAKRDSVPISSDLKTKIRTYVFHLRELIEKAEDLDDTKRQILLHRLSDFEAELEKKRLNLTAVAVLAITFLGAPGALLESADAANRLVTNILHVVNAAKMADDATRRLPSSEPPMAITGPRSDSPSPRIPPMPKFDDDEIPF